MGGHEEHLLALIQEADRGIHGGADLAETSDLSELTEQNDGMGTVVECELVVVSLLLEELLKVSHGSLVVRDSLASESDGRDVPRELGEDDDILTLAPNHDPLGELLVEFLDIGGAIEGRTKAIEHGVAVASLEATRTTETRQVTEDVEQWNQLHWSGQQRRTRQQEHGRLGVEVLGNGDHRLATTRVFGLGAVRLILNQASPRVTGEDVDGLEGALFTLLALVGSCP